MSRLRRFVWEDGNGPLTGANGSALTKTSVSDTDVPSRSCNPDPPYNCDDDTPYLWQIYQDLRNLQEQVWHAPWAPAPGPSPDAMIIASSEPSCEERIMSGFQDMRKVLYSVIIDHWHTRAFLCHRQLPFSKESCKVVPETSCPGWPVVAARSQVAS
jgi:hypothetical protein